MFLPSLENEFMNLAATISSSRSLKITTHLLKDNFENNVLANMTGAREKENVKSHDHPHTKRALCRENFCLFSVLVYKENRKKFSLQIQYVFKARRRPTSKLKFVKELHLTFFVVVVCYLRNISRTITTSP